MARTTTADTKSRKHVSGAPSPKKKPPRTRKVPPKSTKKASAASVKKTSAARTKPRDPVTLRHVSEQLSNVLARLEAIEVAIRGLVPDTLRPSTDHGAVPPQDALDDAFERALLGALSERDRVGRHGGLVPISELRDIFTARGWDRATFDRRLLEAEREFVLDLKVASDPTRLPRPDLAIDDAGRGLLQYAVAR